MRLGGASLLKWSITVQCVWVGQVFSCRLKKTTPSKKDVDQLISGCSVVLLISLNRVFGSRIGCENATPAYDTRCTAIFSRPLVSDFDCSKCGLGYETTSATNTTCIKPPFRPYRGWEVSTERARLQLQDIRDIAIEYANSTNNSTGVPILFAEHTYTIPAPQLDKDDLFVGYMQPFSKIHFELDFLKILAPRAVDIGCGTTVVGNGAGDSNIPRKTFAHPLSMNRAQFQYPFRLEYFPDR